MPLPPLQPDFVRFLEDVEAQVGPPPSRPTIEDRRRRLAAIARRFDAPRPPLAGVDDRRVPAGTVEVPVRVYRPHGADRPPAIVYFHGGGWVAGTLDTHDLQAATLAAETGAVVVSVDYRLAPEHRHPAATDDCWAALQWVTSSSGDLGIDASNIALAGDSAGAQLAVACALRARRSGTPAALRLQALIYPALDSAADTASYERFASAPMLGARDMRDYWTAYLGTSLEGDDVLSSPLRADCSGLPPTLLLLAEIDPLHDEGAAFAARLRCAGVPVEVLQGDGLTHGFLRALGCCPSAQREMRRLCARIRTALFA